MSLSLFGLDRQNTALSGELREAFASVLSSGAFVLGQHVASFERAVAKLVGVKHAVGLSSGTDALICALHALGCGPGSEVIAPAFSFFATAEAVRRVGATLRLADVQPATLGLDPAAVRRALSPRTRAVLPVHLYGAPVALDELSELAREAGVALVEDAAQAFGARFAGRAVGSWGTAACFSFFPTKPLGGFGDGGMLVTDDGALADRVRRLRVHGASDKHHHVELGGNYRLDALQAALLSVKLPRVEAWRQARAEHVAHYREGLAGLEGIRLLEVPERAESAHALFTVRVSGAGRRDALAQALAARGIATGVYYPKPLHLQPALGADFAAGQFPEAERASEEVLSLPLFADMTRAEVSAVIDAVRGECA